MKNLISGKVIGGMLLVAGSCIGAGMLALPILTGLSGFFPSLSMFFLAWVFMTFTALLLVEVNGWFKGQINIVSMAGKAIGKVGRIVSWLLYLFLFYSLLVAYISGSGTIFAGFLSKISGHAVPNWTASVFFVLLFGMVVYFGTKPVDLFNRLLMAGLIVAYLGMVFSGLEEIHPSYLFHSDTSYMIFPLPVLIVSFGFHNMIPSLTAYLGGDLKKMRATIIGGSLIALIVYLIWEIIVMGVVPFDGENGILDTYRKGNEATHALDFALGNSTIGFFAQGFAFFAIITSFLAQSLTLMHFIADGIHVKPTRKHNSWLILVTLIPPLFFSLVYPKVFYQALSLAGGIGAVLLFGTLPAVMAWVGRYKKRIPSSYHVKGGKVSLVLASLFALFVVIQEVLKLFGIIIK